MRIELIMSAHNGIISKYVCITTRMTISSRQVYFDNTYKVHTNTQKEILFNIPKIAKRRIYKCTSHTVLLLVWPKIVRDVHNRHNSVPMFRHIKPPATLFGHRTQRYCIHNGVLIDVLMYIHASPTAINVYSNVCLHPKQLIGWREVPRPNSRSEIVQAMRRIRVSFQKQSFLLFSTIL